MLEWRDSCFKEKPFSVFKGDPRRKRVTIHLGEDLAEGLWFRDGNLMGLIGFLSCRGRGWAFW